MAAAGAVFANGLRKNMAVRRGTDPFPFLFSIIRSLHKGVFFALNSKQFLLKFLKNMLR